VGVGREEGGREISYRSEKECVERKKEKKNRKKKRRHPRRVAVVCVCVCMCAGRRGGREMVNKKRKK